MAALDAQGLIAKLKLVMGQDPLDRERLYQDMWKRNRHTSLRSIGAMDIALDIATGGGRAAYKLGGYRQSIRAYASSAIMTSRSEYAEEAVRYRDGGWAAYKFPPTEWREDIEVCGRCATVGDDFDIMLDSTWSYSYERSGWSRDRGVEFYWYEDPLADDDLMGCIKLREKLSVTMTTEYSPGGFTNYVPWIINKATDYRGDVAVERHHADPEDRPFDRAFGMNYSASRW